MAKVDGALFSMNATGQIGKVVTYSKWKGQGTARGYTKPANPKTAAQVAQRSALSNTTAAWQNYFTNGGVRTSWNVLAGTLPTPMSGFNAFSSVVTRGGVIDSDMSMVSELNTLNGTDIDVDLLNIDDGSAGDETGNFEVFTGTTKTGLVSNGTGTLTAGNLAITFTNALPSGRNYVVVRKAVGGNVVNRSGIFSVDV